MARLVKDFNRFELKYLISRPRAEDFVRELAPYVTRDPYCPEDTGYHIHSVYADSADRALFWEKIEGIKFRRKVRFRRYGGDSSAFLEIKQRTDRTLQKRRVRWPLDRTLEAFFSDLDPAAVDGDLAPDDRVASEILFLWHHYDLRPAMGISYQRRAFFGKNESDLRITFDSRVQYHPSDLGLDPLPDRGKYVIDPGLEILEIKYTHSVPFWLCRMVGRFGLGLVRMSKYCSAVDREYYGGRLT